MLYLLKRGFHCLLEYINYSQKTSINDLSNAIYNKLHIALENYTNLHPDIKSFINHHLDHNFLFIAHSNDRFQLYSQQLSPYTIEISPHHLKIFYSLNNTRELPNNLDTIDFSLYQDNELLSSCQNKVYLNFKPNTDNLNQLNTILETIYNNINHIHYQILLYKQLSIAPCLYLTEYFDYLTYIYTVEHHSAEQIFELYCLELFQRTKQCPCEQEKPFPAYYYNHTFYAHDFSDYTNPCYQFQKLKYSLYLSKELLQTKNYIQEKYAPYFQFKHHKYMNILEKYLMSINNTHVLDRYNELQIFLPNNTVDKIKLKKI